MSVPIPGMSSRGAAIQPSRQPVINQDLEKVLVLTMRSSAEPNSRKEGATLSL